MTLPTTHSRQQESQLGFTLLEVLIALLILSIGLLGLAALQTTGLRSNQMASMRTLATQLTYDITDRMRSNPTGVNASPGQYIIARTDSPATTPATTAETDLAEWRNNVTTRLPNGMSEITLCPSIEMPDCTEVTHVITVYWNESRRDTSAVPATFNCPPVSDTDFRCFRLIYSE